LCSKTVDASDGEILNFMYRSAYKDVENKALTNDAWVKAREKAEGYYLVALNKSSPGWFRLVDEYYMKMLDQRVTDKEKEMVILMDELE